MRYLTLTSDSSKYQCTSAGGTVVLQWNVHHDFTNISDIGITSITFSGFKKIQGHDVKVPIYSNLITRTVTNPKRNILTIRIPKNSSVAECQLNMSRCNVWFAKYIHFFRYSWNCSHSSWSDYSLLREYWFASFSVRNKCNIQSAQWLDAFVWNQEVVLVWHLVEGSVNANRGNDAANEDEDDDNYLSVWYIINQSLFYRVIICI